MPEAEFFFFIELARGRVCEWLINIPAGTFYFTPTSAPWLNAVEGFVAMLTRRPSRTPSGRIVAAINLNRKSLK
jgi:hypothetical protein